jgi:hypothetical protein
MAVRNYFSGVEGQQHFDAATDAGAQHVLMSYLYARKAGLDLVKRRKQQHPHLKFMIDSGAHTFQSSCHNHPVYSKWKEADYEKYLEEYIEWLEANRQYIECAVELDISYPINVSSGRDSKSNYGYDVIANWQKSYFIPLQQTGMEIIYVFHGGSGGAGREIQVWEEMCSQFPYVGLPGEKSSDPDFNKYITVARRYTTKIHGFAATKQADFRDWPWFSIDSTTWKSSERYGTLIHWDPHQQRLLFEEDKSKRAKYRKYFQKFGLNAQAIIDDTNYREVTKYALISMSEMEKFYQQKYSTRTFYYELRLPPAKVIKKMKSAEIQRWWKILRAESLFKEHTGLNFLEQQAILMHLSAVQYKEANLVQSAASEKFLSVYFQKQLVLGPIEELQKELAVFIAPPNPPAMQRTASEHYIATNSPPRRRADEIIDPDDLEFDPTEYFSIMGDELD